MHLDEYKYAVGKMHFARNEHFSEAQSPPSPSPFFVRVRLRRMSLPRRCILYIGRSSTAGICGEIKNVGDLAGRKESLRIIANSFPERTMKGE